MNDSVSDINGNKRILDYDRPVSYDGMMKYLEILSDRYKCISIVSIGESILGHSIPMISLGGGNKEVMYIGAISGTDRITTQILLRFINEYCEIRQSNRRIYNLNLKSIEDSRTISIIPMLNPDGTDYVGNGVADDNPIRSRLLSANGGSEDFSCWRANARGVDLSRNFNYNFAVNKKREMGDGILNGRDADYSGTHPESEPETGALCGTIRFNQRIKLLLELKNGHGSVCCNPESRAVRAKSIAQSLCRVSGYAMTRETPESLAGSLCGWCSEECGIPSYSVTCGDDRGSGRNSCFQVYAGLRELLFVSPVLV